ncbi:MAG: DUF1496 domain-containing protein [Pseudoalteromonas sp.]
MPITSLLTSNVCWYEDKRYSQDAIILMADAQIIYSTKNPNHNKSELSWPM